MAATASVEPLISIITATYNRSNVLRYALASVRRSTRDDWEHVVVGDGCTDDTADVVAEAGDPRVRFHNLPTNFGEQSAPNNRGFELARGRYVAYLNHDDLWFPDHLDTLVTALVATRADLVYTPVLVLAPDQRHYLLGAGAGDRYDPTVAVPASAWLVRRELIAELGGWRPYHRCFTYPSHDLLWRAWRAGKTVRMVPRVTVLAVLSGTRTGVYATGEFHEQRDAFERMVSEPEFRERELARVAIAATARAAAPRTGPIGWLHAGRRLILDALDIPPSGLRLWLRYRGKGGLIHDLRRRRGLHPLP
jgi:glycosyltransferase involved in cell wall biosynthesis